MLRPGATHMTRANSSCRTSTLPSHVRPGHLTHWQAILRRLGCHAEVDPGVRLVVNSGINMARPAVATATKTSMRASVSKVMPVASAASAGEGRYDVSGADSCSSREKVQHTR